MKIKLILWIINIKLAINIKFTHKEVGGFFCAKFPNMALDQVTMGQ